MLTCWDAVDAGVLDRSVVEQARKDLLPWEFEMLYECKAPDQGLNPYGYATIAAATRAALSQKPTAAFGWDLAKTMDWTVGIGLDEDGAVTHISRWQKTSQGEDKTYWERTIARIKRETGDVPAFVDSTGLGDPIIEQLQAAGRNFHGFKFTETSRKQLIDGQAAALQGGKCFLYDGSEDGKQLAREMEAMQIVDVNGKPHYQVVPNTMHDDCLFSHALAVRKLTRPMRTFFVA